MNTHLQFLTATEAKAVYKTYLKHHFPKDETKPWKSIERMWKRDEYFAVGIYEDDVSAGADALRGYAFFVEPQNCDACLLDYYAILPEYRSGGLGGRSLQELAELCAQRGRYILLETEDLDFARNAAQTTARKRRDAFYERNGCVKTDVKGSIFTVRYAVWCRGTPADLSDPADRDALFDRACRDMNTLYRLMVPGEKNALFVKIQRT
ncbi:MAG: GNAT family N-acetyltransferase [Clostridia bacterium]|nr:GNAT family N-acetyltransferase [Clostridia bacterium]